MLTKNQILDAIKRTLISYKTNILDREYSTIQYVDDSIASLEDTNKYKLITCDDPLVINKTDITDIADATVTIDNLTGQYGNLTANENGTWTYTLNGFMNGLETFTFTVGETTQDLVIVPYKEMVYNDNNAEIGYSGTWDVESGTEYSNRSTHKTSQKGATATFTFTGTGVDIYTRTNDDVGLISAELYSGKGCYKDDGKYKPTLKTQYIDNVSTSGDYYQIPTLSFEDLDYGTYTVVITAGAKGQGTSGTYYLDGIRVYNSLNITNLKINDLYRLEKKQNNFLHIDRKNTKYTPTHDYDPATKVYVDDSINTIPKQLIPLSTLISIDADNKKYIEINQFDIDKTYIIIDDNTTQQKVYSSSSIYFTLNGEKISTVIICSYSPFITLGIRSSTNKLYFGNNYSYYEIDISEKLSTIIDGMSLKKKANTIDVLTKNNTIEYIPANDYNPSTKKYVDDTITEQITSSQATDEEVNTMLQTVLGGDYSNEQ